MFINVNDKRVVAFVVLVIPLFFDSKSALLASGTMKRTL